MNRKFLFLLVASFLLVVNTKAQPGCGFKFNPFSLCGADYEKSQFIFYGEVVSFERGSKAKAAIKIMKVFKGKLPENIELFVDPNEVFCENLPVKGRYIFTADRVAADNHTVYFSRRWSTPVTDYSEEGLKDVFLEIDTILANKAQYGLSGYVLQVSHSKNPQMSLEQKERLLYDPDVYRTFPNVTVEAKSEADGKIYRTKTDESGKYTFDKLPLGKYDLTVFVEGQEAFPKTAEATGQPCHRTDIVVKSKRN